MFCIEHENFQLMLQVVPVASLVQHEETISDRVERLSLELKNWASLHDPIIINENNVVLDGNHRVAVFKEMKFKYIAVCRINDLHEGTRLRYWYRVIRSLSGPDVIKRAAEELGGKWQEIADRDIFITEFEKHLWCCGVQRGNFFASIHFSEKTVNDAVSAYKILSQIQKKLELEGATMEYIPCHYVYKADFCASLNMEEVVLWTPQITKEMVIEAAMRQKLFPPKTTRYLIPARPLNVNVPTHWFKKEAPLLEINRRFADHLGRKAIRHLGPGQVLHGRYYEEDLFVFLDKDPSAIDIYEGVK